MIAAKPRGPLMPPNKRHKDERKERRQDVKQNLRKQWTGRTAGELTRIAQELIARRSDWREEFDKMIEAYVQMGENDDEVRLTNDKCKAAMAKGNKFMQQAIDAFEDAWDARDMQERIPEKKMTTQQRDLELW